MTAPSLSHADPLGLPSTGTHSVSEAALLKAFLHTYNAEVHEVVAEIIPFEALRKPRLVTLEPILYTHSRRRNLMRAGFSMASGRTVGNIQDGVIAAAVGELAWTCALVLDDILDGSAERDGHAAAHIMFGRRHTVASATVTLAAIARYLVTTRRTSLSVRIRMEGLATRLLARCSAAALTGRRNVHDHTRYMKYARGINACTHWAVVAPMLGSHDPQAIAAGWAYADAASRNGKLRNDLFDYCGGSTESDTPYKDFHQRLVTFPVLVLLQRDLDPRDRAEIHAHFYTHGPSELDVQYFISLLLASGALSQYIVMMEQEAIAVERAAESIDLAYGGDQPLSLLMRSWCQCVISASVHAVERVATPIQDTQA